MDRKHPTRQFWKISVLGGMVSWKIVCVLTKFSESPPGKFDLFLWYLRHLFFILETLMCSNEFLDNISWKIWSVLMIFFRPRKSYVFLRNFIKLFWKFWCVLVRFASPGKFTCVLVQFLVLLEKLTCSK